MTKSSPNNNGWWTLVSVACWAGCATSVLLVPVTWIAAVTSGSLGAFALLASERYWRNKFKSLVQRTEQVSAQSASVEQRYLAAEAKLEALRAEADTYTTQLELITGAHVNAVADLAKLTEEYDRDMGEAKATNDKVLAQLEVALAKIYDLPLVCSYCGAQQMVEFDLSKGQYTCDNCLNINGVHTNIHTARITDPLVDARDIKYAKPSADPAI